MTQKWIAPANVASLGIDAQPTFCTGGGLPVDGGHEIMSVINKVRSQMQKGYWTQDWHPVGHCSFASTHGLEPFTEVLMKDGEIVPEGTKGAYTQMLWPDHGQQGSEEAKLHPDLVIPEQDLILQKGDNPLIDAYSCVFENDKKTRPQFANGNTLPEQLRKDGIDTVVLSGLVLDVCVADGATDLKAEGFRVIVVLDATAAISPEGKVTTLEKFKQLGIETCNANDLPRLLGIPTPTPGMSPT